MTQKVFFLGAGFSRALHPKFPLMKELTKEVTARLEKDSVKKHLEEIAAPITKDFETLLTYLGTDWPWKSDTTRHANLALYSAIIQNLSDIFRELALKYIYVNDYLVHETFYKFALQVVKQKKQNNFITLNYDVLLEHLLWMASNWEMNYNDFYKYPMSLLDTRTLDSSSIALRTPHPEAPAILKLHGSANWFWTGVTASDDIYFSDNRDRQYENSVMGLKPYIIPPVLDKNAFYAHRAIQALWKKAEELLKQADEIYIIGFSFPQTDLSVRYLFQSALRNSEPDIYVVNRAKEDELRSIYQDVLQGQCVDYEYTGKENAVEVFLREVILSEAHQ